MSDEHNEIDESTEPIPSDRALVLGTEAADLAVMDYHNRKTCAVCTHPHKELIEAMYLDVRPLDEITALFGKWKEEFEFTQKELQVHVDFAGLTGRRALNDDGYMRLIKEKGVEVLGKQGFEVKPELLFKAIKHSDEKQGRMPQRTKESGPRVTLVLQGKLPQLGGELPPPDAIEAEFEEVDEEEEDEVVDA